MQLHLVWMCCARPVHVDILAVLIMLQVETNGKLEEQKRKFRKLIKSLSPGSMVVGSSVE